MKLCKKRPTNKTTQNPSSLPNGETYNIQPVPPMEHRFSYIIDIIKADDSFLPEFERILPYNGYCVNEPNPLTGRILAFQLAAEIPNDPKLSRNGKLCARIYFVDETQHGCRLMYDALAEPSIEVCQNLEYEYNLYKNLGYTITDWDLLTSPDGIAYHAIRSEFRIAELCPSHFEPVLNPNTALMDSISKNNKYKNINL